jgi:hypothetical protein
MIHMPLPAGPTIAVSATEPLIGCVTWADDGTDWGFQLMLIDRGDDRRSPPPRRERLGSIDSVRMEMTARSQVSINVQHLTMVGFGGACDVPIERALEVYGTFDEEDGAGPRQLIGLVVSRLCREGVFMGVVGAPAHVRSLEGPLSPVPANLRSILARSDGAARDEWSEAPITPGTLALGPDLVFLRGTYGNELLLRGTDVVEDNDGGSEFKAFAEIGPRRLLMMAGPSDDVAIDIETRHPVSYCVNWSQRGPR